MDDRGFPQICFNRDMGLSFSGKEVPPFVSVGLRGLKGFLGRCRSVDPRTPLLAVPRASFSAAFPT